MCLCVYVCVFVCVCVWGGKSSCSETITSSIIFFIYIEMNKIHVLNNPIHQAKSSYACFRMMKRSGNNEYDLNDME